LGDRVIDILKERLELQKQKNRYRITRALDDSLIDFCSNDYLGIGREGGVISWRGVAGASRLLGGDYPEINQLEHEMAQFFGFQHAILFPSGFQCNMAVISALAHRKIIFYYDELIHASLRDAIRCYAYTSIKFKHNRIDMLWDLYRRYGGPAIVVVESLYSMSGDFCNAPELSRFLIETNSYVIVDEAHTAGWFNTPNLLWYYSNLPHSNIIGIIVTLGKAFGCSGAVLLCDSLVHQSIINFGRAYIYTTRPHPAMVNIIKNAFYKVITAKEEREKLYETIKAFNTIIERNEHSPIFFHVCDCENTALWLSDHLIKHGYGVFCVRPPSAPRPGIRIVLHSFNTIQQIQGLMKQIKDFHLMHHSSQ